MEPAGHRREQPAAPRRRSGRPAGRNGARRSSAGAEGIRDETDRYLDLPQWSPPVIGGSSILRRTMHFLDDWPQWSPPVIGGSSLDPGQMDRRRPRRNGARRSSAGADPRSGCRHRSPRRRRNGARRSSAGAGGIWGTGEVENMMPQWSPPVIGGSSGRPQRQDEAHDDAAMEPAGHRREQLVTPPDWAMIMRPQWSPPVIGGSSI